MSVFTIYCHGTGSHRDYDDSEIVCFMGRRARGREYENYLILDGVGAPPKNTDGSNPMAGSFDWADRNKGSKKGLSKEMGGGSSTKGTKFGKLIASLGGGAGLEDNVRHAIVAIANLPELPTTINLIGWSRGAVTCLYIANTLFDPSSTEGLFRSVNVNIFAVDPVSGMKSGYGKNAEYRRLVPPIVRNYLGVLATGENRKTFKPQDLSRIQVVDNKMTNLMFLPFPGKHATVAKNADPSAKDVSDIIWTLAHRFMESFGTVQESKPFMLTNEQMLEAYSSILMNKGSLSKIKHKSFAQRVIGMGFQSRDINKNMDQYVRDSEYFVNEHHRVLFERICPALFGWLFGGSVSAFGLTSKTVDKNSPIGREVGYAIAFRPNFVASLEMLGVTVDPVRGTVKLPAPRSSVGSGLNETQANGSLSRMGVIF